MTVAERLDTVACLKENRERRSRDESHVPVESEARSRQDEDSFLLMQRLHERLVVREFEVLQSSTHQVHGALRQEGVQPFDRVQASVERFSGRLEFVHRVDVELLGSVGEDRGEGSLHSRVGSLDSERIFGESGSDLGEDALRVVNHDPSESPSGSEPALRDGTDDEDRGISAD